MSLRHKRQEKLRRTSAFRVFLEANPPRMPADFSHRDWKRVTSYAFIAFSTGWNSGQKDMHRSGKGATIDVGTNSK